MQGPIGSMNFRVALIVVLALIDGSTSAKFGGNYGAFNYGYRNFQCIRERNCGTPHGSGPINGISESDCHLKCRSDPACVASLHRVANDAGTCWLDNSIASVCRTTYAAWTKAEGFSYCVATCSQPSVANGAVQIEPSDVVVMPAVAAGVEATLTCSPGFSPSGPTTAKCQTNGLWSEALSCVADEDDTGLKSLLPG